MRRIVLKCGYIYCQKEFFPKFGWEEKQKYCSENHRKLAWKYANKEKNRLQQKRRYKELHPEIQIKKICIVCKNEFITDSNHHYQRFCSQYCRNKFSRTPEQRKKWSKTWREKHHEQIKKKDAIYKSKRRFGVTSNTLNADIVVKRDHYTCRLCGEPYQVIHHIKYSGKYWDLVCLCRACHARIHSKIKEEPFWIGEYDFEDYPA